MARRRVLAYFVDETGAAAASKLLDDADVSGGIAYGELHEDDVPALTHANVLVEWLDERPPPLLSRPRRRTPYPVFGVAALPSDPDELLLLSEPSPLRRVDFYVLRLVGPLLPRWRKHLLGEEVELLEHQGDFSWTVRLRLDQLAQVQALDFVDGLRQYTFGDTVHPGHLTTRRLTATTEPEVPFELITHRRADVDALLQWLKQRAMTTLLAAGRKVRFRTFRHAAELRELAHRPEVATLYEYVVPTPFNDRARVIVGVDPAGGPQHAGIAQTGRRQTVGISDTGLDGAHPDFAGRVAKLIARGRPGLTDDPDGHGTHVVGSIIGTGAASHGAIRGIAPEAALVVQSLLDPAGTLEGGLQPSAADVLDESYQAGARIHNASWGVAGNGSSYRAESREVDEFVHDHPDMLVVVAAGNDGSAEAPRSSPPGFIDLMSISTPATAKNALTVGASRTDRTAIGRQIPTWGAWDGLRFPAPPVQNELMSGDPESMAALSSRGPCGDQARVKPDLVAPGTYVLSARANAAQRNFWADYPANRHYAYDGGTSMAAPLVSGCAALVRQYFADEHEHEPSAALLKAVLAAGARPLTGPDAVATYPGPPNFHQGFGCVSLTTSMPNAAAPGMALSFNDAWDGDDMELTETFKGVRFSFSSDGALSLRIGLAWTDPPGDHLQNVLQLLVGHSASLQTWLGNTSRPTLTPGTPDVNNNIQIARIQQPPPGDFIVQVQAQTLTIPGQRFAVVVTGGLTAPLAVHERY